MQPGISLSDKIITEKFENAHGLGSEILGGMSLEPYLFNKGYERTVIITPTKEPSAFARRQRENAKYGFAKKQEGKFLSYVSVDEKFFTDGYRHAIFTVGPAEMDIKDTHAKTLEELSGRVCNIRAGTSKIVEPQDITRNILSHILSKPDVIAYINRVSIANKSPAWKL
ncbi:hypothetical protein GF323_06455 [Candidatus Woesearchaeota archaeon]|nr:hypothetical protein [Candidatus Woesearchaeota archaeon]